MYGCPYCYGRINFPEYNRGKLDANKIRKRECPVCSSKLKNYEYLIGRMWDTEVKTHLKIIGCIKCRKSYKKYFSRSKE